MWHCTSNIPALRRPAPQDHTTLVWLQAGAASAKALREAVMRAGAEAVRFLRVDACASGGPVRALLCIDAAAAPRLRAELARRLPGCDWHEAPRRADTVHAH